MNYTSTRDSALCTGASTAILTGIAPGGGLFVPQQFPQVDMREFYGLTYPQTAQKVLGMFLTDYDPDFLKTATEQTYSTENFGGKAGFAVCLTTLSLATVVRKPRWHALSPTRPGSRMYKRNWV